MKHDPTVSYEELAQAVMNWVCAHKTGKRWYEILSQNDLILLDYKLRSLGYRISENK